MLTDEKTASALILLKQGVSPSLAAKRTESVAFQCLNGTLRCTNKVFTCLAGVSLSGFDAFSDYLKMLRTPFTKICRLRFLRPDGSTAYALDNSPRNKRNRAFIADGNLTVNLQNGMRRTATVTVWNADGEFDYAVGKLWYGQEVALDEGLILSDGTEFYIQQGVFVMKDPESALAPASNIVKLSLVDKWASLDGTLRGGLIATHQIPVGTNVYAPITTILDADRGNGLPVDNTAPVYTLYYDDKTQTLPDGTSVKLTDTPYTITIDSESGTDAEIILALAETLNAWVGYDTFGHLRVDPSQDDVDDQEKALIWEFSTEETTLLGMTYRAQNTAVYNDYIVTGEQLENYTQPSARVMNLDPASATNVNLIGRKTFRESKSGYVTDEQCRDYAMWKLKRSAVLQNSVTIQCAQILHMEENKLVSIARTDKTGSPRELHLVTGFTRPLASDGAMQITATSVADLPTGTLIQK